MATAKNLSAVRGDKVVWELTLKDVDDAAFDLTGYTGKFTVKRGIADTDANKVYQSSIAVTDDTGGVCEARIAVTDWVNPFIPRSYYYDVEIQNAGGDKIYTILTGRLTVKQDIYQG